MRENESGQAMVEFTMIFVIMIIILIGTIDVGRTIYMTMNINMISQEAVRMGSLGQSDVEIQAYVAEKFKLGDTAKLTTTITPNDVMRASGDYLNIEITYPMEYYMPGIGFVLPSQVASSSTMRVE